MTASVHDMLTRSLRLTQPEAMRSLLARMEPTLRQLSSDNALDHPERETCLGFAEEISNLIGGTDA
jgi:hypothetical protein